MAEYRIIRTCKSHIGDILEIEQLSFTVPWSRDSFINEIDNKKYTLYLSAVAGIKTIGYIGMWKVTDEGHITNVAVHPQYRRNGVAKALLSELIRLAHKNHITSMTLEVRISNKFAINLYRQFGFEEKGFRKRYYSDNGEDALIMWKFNV